MNLDAEALIQKAIDGMARDYFDEGRVEDMIRTEASTQVRKILLEKAPAAIDEVLKAGIQDHLNLPFRPVNQWGEQTGKETTLRDEIQTRAAEFWQVKVDGNGTPSNYGGKPRHEHMFTAIAKEQFAAAIKENIDLVIAGFRDALRKDAGVMLGEHIERFIKAPARK